MQQQGRVLIVDDHPISRDGLTLAARVALRDATVVGVGTIAAALAALGTNPYFNLIMLDFELPDARGYSGLLALQHQAPKVPIVIVTARQEPSLVEAARALGAFGYIFKTAGLDAIVERLRAVLAGLPVFPLHASVDTGLTAARARIAELSRAQRAVLLALADGRSNKVIARDLAVTEATVKAHLTAIFRKLGVANRTQALLTLGPLFQAGERPAQP